MNVRIFLRLAFIVLFTAASFYFLAKAAKASAQRIEMEEEKMNMALVSQTSNTEYIFFESISKFVTASVVK